MDYPVNLHVRACEIALLNMTALSSEDRGCTRSGHPVHHSFPPFVRAGGSHTRTHLASGPSTVSVLRDRSLLERGAQPLGKLDRVVVRPEMHEEHSRLLGEHVAMDCRHPDPVLA